MSVSPTPGNRLLNYASDAAAPEAPLVAPAPVAVPYAQSATFQPTSAYTTLAAPIAPPSAQSYRLASWQSNFGSWLSAMNQIMDWASSLVNVPPVPQPPTPPTQSPPKSPQPSNPSTPSQPSAKGPTKFIVSTFNILGSSHTAPGADKASWDSGVQRMPAQIALLRQKNISVVGFQEMCNDQAKAFRQQAGKEYGLWPGQGKKFDIPLNSIGWRKSEWDFVSGGMKEVPTFRGDWRPFVYVTLKNKQTGKEVIFVNFHNPPGGDQKGRDEALTIETAFLSKLRKDTGLPIVITGDMNERENTYDRMTKEANLHASNEGPKGQRPKGMRIEWIFGSDEVKFDHHSRDDVTKKKQISDHDIVWSGVTIK